jgi:hypothetical protein
MVCGIGMCSGREKDCPCKSQGDMHNNKGSANSYSDQKRRKGPKRNCSRS